MTYTTVTDPVTGKIIEAHVYATPPAALGPNEAVTTQAAMAAFRATLFGSAVGQSPTPAPQPPA